MRYKYILLPIIIHIGIVVLRVFLYEQKVLKQNCEGCGVESIKRFYRDPSGHIKGAIGGKGESGICVTSKFVRDIRMKYRVADFR